MVLKFIQVWRQRRQAFYENHQLGRQDQNFPYLAEQDLMAAKIAAARGDDEGALRLWAGVRARFPGEKAAYVNALAVLRKLRRFEEMERLALQGREHFPTDPAFACDYAQVADLSGNTDAALERWEQVRSDFPQLPAGFVRGAECLRRAGRLDEAEALLDSAVERLPNQSGPLAGKALIAQERGLWAEALQQWETIRAKFRPRIDVFLGIVKCLQALERTEEAEAVLAEGRQAFPTHAVLPFEYAAYAERRRDWPEALLRWEWLRDRFPRQPRSHIGCARVLRQLKRPDDAEAVIETALDMFPDDLSVLLEHARIAHYRRDWQKAEQRWTRVLSLRPDNPEALRRQAEARAAQSETVDAKAVEPQPLVHTS